MREAGEFRRVAILGAGLIGASFGAAVKKARPNVSIAAYDRPEVLRKLQDSGFEWEIFEDWSHALREADLVYIALPIGVEIELLPQIALRCDANALVTDTGSTKVEICKVGEKAFKHGVKFLGGHPIAGKELGGPGHADGTLFRGKKYALISEDTEKKEESDFRVQQFIELVRAIGAEPAWIDAQTHDWAVAVVSQMPQMVAIALARVISGETDETGLPASLAGNGLRDLMRTAGSPYEMWRDICVTNRGNIARSLDRVAQAIDFLRTHLTSRELEQEFRTANKFYRMLHEMDFAPDGDERSSRERISKAGTNG